MRSRTLSVVFAFLMLLCVSVAHADDFALLLGPPGSMERSDPKSLHKEAAKLFVRLLEKGDRVLVVKFAGQATVLSELMDVSTSRFSILRAISKAGPEGESSNIYDALNKAKELLLKEPAEKRTIVLITDKGIELGTEDRNEEYALRLLDELLPELKKKGIRIYTVALTEHADFALLKEIALQSHGLFYKADSPEKLHSIFADIYANIKLADEIPLEKQTFVVDRDAKELKLLISKKKSTSSTTLLQPDGRRVNYKRHPSHYRWYSSRAYELVLISRPLPGKWKIISGDSSETRVFVQSDFRLKITDIPRVVKAGRKQKLYMWLQRGERILKNTSLVLRAAEFDIQIEPPQKKPLKVLINDDGAEDDDLAKDGVYTGSFSPEEKGIYRVRFIAKGKGFYREKLLRFYAKGADKKTEVAKKEGHRKIRSDRKPVTVKTTDNEQEYSLKRAFVKFAIFNGVLLSLTGICFGFILFLKKRKAHEPEEEEESED